MFLAILLAVAVALLVGTAVLQRRTRRRLTGTTGLDAQAALTADGVRELGRERARMESHAVRRIGEGGGGL